MNLAQPDSLAPEKQSVANGYSLSKGLRRRWPFYAGGLGVIVLALAWIDGGEEPLHPIAQAVDLKAPVSETR